MSIAITTSPFFDFIIREISITNVDYKLYTLKIFLTIQYNPIFLLSTLLSIMTSASFLAKNLIDLDRRVNLTIEIEA